MVCSITRGPAKPISASGSAMMTSPSIATEAATPPVVGWSSTEMYGTLASRSRLRAAEVLAICISDSTPSCMRAPPDAQNMTAGRLMRERALELAGDLLTHHGAHRAAHELEREEPGLHGDAADRRGAGAIGIARADLAGRGLDLVDVLLAIDPEPQRIAALQVAVVLLPLAVIDDHLDPALGRHPEVMMAAGADPEVGVQIRLVERCAAPLTFCPNPLGD